MRTVLVGNGGTGDVGNGGTGDGETGNGETGNGGTSIQKHDIYSYYTSYIPNISLVVEKLPIIFLATKVILYV